MYIYSNMVYIYIYRSIPTKITLYFDVYILQHNNQIKSNQIYRDIISH